jgi:membrane protease YdiL (CAAX protease family)
MKRLAIFLRSVIPADPDQLIFLVGVVFLFVSPRLPWWPSKILGDDSRSQFVGLMATWLWPIIFVGLAGYFVCLWPGKTPVRRILGAVCFPTVLSLLLILCTFFRLTRTTASIFQSHDSLVVLKWLQLNAWKLSAGFYFCTAGLMLVLIYTIRLTLGFTSLPLRLPNENATGEGSAHSRLRVRLLTFVLVGPYFLIPGLLGFLLVGLPYIFSKTAAPAFMDVSAKLAPALDAALLVCTSVCILGKQGRSAARSSLRLPEPRYALLGLLLPFVLGNLFPAAQYVVDRVHWAANDFGKFGPPQFSSYIGLANGWQPLLLLMVFGAFAEEIVFRGMLLPNFLDRYGLHRGIFLTGLVWAAIHFRSDSYSGMSVGGVLLHLANRTIFCLVFNFVLAWMTLRWNSIIPAAIAHTTWNILVTAQWDSRELWNWGQRSALWAILAYVLFRFWPITWEKTAASVPPDAYRESVA